MNSRINEIQVFPAWSSWRRDEVQSDAVRLRIASKRLCRFTTPCGWIAVCWCSLVQANCGRLCGRKDCIDAIGSMRLVVSGWRQLMQVSAFCHRGGTVARYGKHVCYWRVSHNTGALENMPAPPQFMRRSPDVRPGFLQTLHWPVDRLTNVFPQQSQQGASQQPAPSGLKPQVTGSVFGTLCKCPWCRRIPLGEKPSAL